MNFLVGIVSDTNTNQKHLSSIVLLLSYFSEVLNPYFLICGITFKAMAHYLYHLLIQKKATSKLFKIWRC